MRNHKKEKMQKVVMVENFNIKDDKNISSLTFFENSFGAFEGNKMQFFIKIKNIKNFEIEVEGIRIFVKEESKKNKVFFL